MGDEGGSEEQPLLSFAEEGRTWQGVGNAPPLRVITLEELFRKDDDVLEILRTEAVQRLGEFSVQVHTHKGRCTPAPSHAEWKSIL